MDKCLKYILALEYAFILSRDRNGCNSNMFGGHMDGDRGPSNMLLDHMDGIECHIHTVWRP